MKHQTILVTFTAVATFAGFTGAAIAAPIVGLTGDKTLVMFDTEKPAVGKTVEVSGVDMLQGIDMRPSDQKLYGVTKDGTIVTIDPETGTATAGKKLATNLPDGVSASVDFNPMADRLRLMGSDGTNLRANPDTGEVTTDGKLAFEANDPGAANPPKIVATAYLNSFGKPESTKMYDLDASGMFIQQTKPNDGTLKTIGNSGIMESDTIAMDIQTTADGTNTIWVASGEALYTVAVETGKATKIGDITGVEGPLRDIAVMPAK
jgi:Domain of unknown function (DUF4394)